MDFNVNESMKAVLAVVVSLVAALVTALSGFGSDASIGDLDAKTWLIAIASVLASGGLVWWVRESSLVYRVRIKGNHFVLNCWHCISCGGFGRWCSCTKLSGFVRPI